MALRWLAATLHLAAFAVGVTALFTRARALLGELDAAGLRRVTTANNNWLVAGLLLIGSGLWRLYGGFDKGAPGYLHNAFFHTKLALVGLLLLLELFPMVTLMRWRMRRARDRPIDFAPAASFAFICYVQLGLLALILLLSTAVARGIG